MMARYTFLFISSVRWGLLNINCLSEPNALVALEVMLEISSSSERDEMIIVPRYVKFEVKVILVPSVKVIGAVSVGLLADCLFGTRRTLVLDFLSMVPECIFVVHDRLY